MLLVYSCIILLFVLQPNTKRKVTNEKSYCAIICVVLFVIAVLREKVHGDLFYYRINYSGLTNRSYNGMFKSWLEGNQKDFGFYAIAKMFSDIGIDAGVWISLIGLFFAVVFACFVKKYYADGFISTIILLALFYDFTFTGLRQTIALAIVMLSCKYITDKKPIKFIVSVCIATLFHSSALIVLPAYLIAKLRVGFKNILAIFVSLIITIFFPNVLKNIIELVAWNDSLERYSESNIALTWSGYIIQLFMFVFAFVFRKNIDRSDLSVLKNIDCFINLTTVGLCLQTFAVVIAEMFRLSYYYSLCNIVLLPMIIANQVKPNNRTVMYAAVLLSFISYMLYSGAYFSYSYFWS